MVWHYTVILKSLQEVHTVTYVLLVSLLEKPVALAKSIWLPGSY